MKHHRRCSIAPYAVYRRIRVARNVLCLVVFGTLVLAGCDDSVTWVDQPKQSFKCDEEEIEDYKKSTSENSVYSIYGERVCPNAGKGEFTGEIRCKNESLQFACKAN